MQIGIRSTPSVRLYKTFKPFFLIHTLLFVSSLFFVYRFISHVVNYEINDNTISHTILLMTSILMKTIRKPNTEKIKRFPRGKRLTEIMWIGHLVSSKLGGLLFDT
jgi:hypothetical protein